MVVIGANTLTALPFKEEDGSDHPETSMLPRKRALKEAEKAVSLDVRAQIAILNQELAHYKQLEQ
jgi:hypothetical protein